MSPSGAVVDCEDLINVLDNLVRYEFKIKNAKDDWKRYIDALHNIIHIQTIVNDICKHRSGQNDAIIIEVDGKRRELVAVCKSNLDKLTKDAGGILQTLQKDGHDLQRSNGWLRLGNRRRRDLFPIDAEKIRNLFQAVEYAKSSLHVAFVVTVLSRTDSGHTKTQRAIQSLREEEVQPVLNKLKECISTQSKKVDQVPRITKRKRKRTASYSASTSTHEASTHAAQRSNETRRQNPVQPTQRAPHRETDESVPPNFTSRKDRSRQHKEPGSSRPVASGALAYEDSETETDTLKDLAFSTDKLDSHSVSDRRVQFDLSESQSSSNESHDGRSEVDSDAADRNYLEPIEISDCPRVYLAKSFDIKLCRLDTKGNVQLCVDSLSGNDADQTFKLKELCTNFPCDHATIEGLGRREILRYKNERFPIRLTGVRSGRRRKFTGIRGSQNPLVFGRCSRECSHTAYKGLGGEYLSCMSAVHFRASISQ
ncbi:hypothetical protein AUP68_03043 [Ilyonectria robusta]